MNPWALAGGAACVVGGLLAGGGAPGALVALVAGVGAGVAFSVRARRVAPEAPPPPPSRATLPMTTAALDGLPVGIVDPRGIVLLWSEEMGRVTGRPPGEMEGRSWEGLFSEADARCGRPESLVAPGARASRVVVHSPHPDGAEHILTLDLAPIPADAPTAWRVVATDSSPLPDEASRRHEAVLEDARRLEAAARLRGELLTGVTHELRTPLLGIVGFARLLHDERVAPLAPAHRQFAADILTSAERLLRLVNDTLDLAKLEAGRMEFRPKEVPVMEALERARALLGPAAAEAGVTLDVEPGESVGIVRLDPDRFEQILVNYLANAVKASPRGRRVVMRARAIGEAWVRVEVEDEGPGISPADVPLLFSDFRQFPRTGSRLAGGGAGLGLALTRRLVEAQRGRVGVHASPAGGCVFFAVLPRRVVMFTGPQVVYHPPDEPIVLLIEPDAERAAHHARALAALGMGVRVAESGEAALDLSQRDRFDLLVLPLVLPDMTGLDVLRALRLELSPTPAVLATPDGGFPEDMGHHVVEVVRADLSSAELALVARSALPRRAPVPPPR